MNIRNGRYFLFVRDVISSDEEIFDFDTRNFVDSDGITEAIGVPITTIDAFTSIFGNANDMLGFVEKMSFDRENDLRIGEIRYIGKDGSEKRLPPIFNDENIRKVVSSSSGSKVNFCVPDILNLFETMYNELLNNDDLRLTLMDGSKQEFKINDHNKKLVSMTKNLSVMNRSSFFFKLEKEFASYREFRAFYLAYLKCSKKRELKDNKNKKLVL